MAAIVFCVDAVVGIIVTSHNTCDGSVTAKVYRHDDTRLKNIFAENRYIGVPFCIQPTYTARPVSSRKIPDLYYSEVFISWGARKNLRVIDCDRL
jgi:hypothetical protein